MKIVLNVCSLSWETTDHVCKRRAAQALGCAAAWCTSWDPGREDGPCGFRGESLPWTSALSAPARVTTWLGKQGQPADLADIRTKPPNEVLVLEMIFLAVR